MEISEDDNDGVFTELGSACIIDRGRAAGFGDLFVVDLELDSALAGRSDFEEEVEEVEDACSRKSAKISSSITSAPTERLNTS